MRSCPRNETRLWRQSTALAIGRREPLGLAEKGQEGGSPEPGSNLRGRSALDRDGNHFSQEAKELIPGSGTERLAQLMEPAPDDEGIELKTLRTESTLTRQSERLGRAARGRRDLLAADLHEEHEASPRNHRRRHSARESSTLGGRGVQVLRTVASASPEWDSTQGTRARRADCSTGPGNVD